MRDALWKRGHPSLTYAVQDPAHRAVPSAGQDAEIRSVPKEAQPGESQERQGVMRGRAGAGGRGQRISRSISIPRRGPAAVQVVHLAWVEQVVKFPKDSGEREE